jgi:hypothetical protein
MQPLVVADGFESGGLANWTVIQEGDATVGVLWPDAHRGNCSGRFQISTASTSRASIARSLPAGAFDAIADGWFRVDGEGQANSNVGFFRFFDGATRIADVYRQNITGGAWFRTRDSRGNFVYTPLGMDLSLGRWYHVRFHVRANGSASTIEVWFDDALRYSSSTFWLQTNRLTTLLLGSEHVSQQMNLRFDDIVLEGS